MNGIFRKTTVRSLRTQNQSIDFVKTCITGQKNFILYSLTNHQLISLPRLTCMRNYLHRFNIDSCLPPDVSSLQVYARVLYSFLIFHMRTTCLSHLILLRKRNKLIFSFTTSSHTKRGHGFRTCVGVTTRATRCYSAAWLELVSPHCGRLE